MTMTIQAKNILLEWASQRPKEHQKILNVALEDSLEKKESVNADVANEIIKVVEEIINKN